MHITTLLLIAWRYLRGTRGEGTTAALVTTSFLGITIGTFALMLVVSVMNGFEKEMHRKMQGIYPQIIIEDYDGDPLNYQAVTDVLTNEFGHAVAAYSPSVTQQAIVQQENEEKGFMVVAIQAIDPAQEPEVTCLHTKLLNQPTDVPPATLLTHLLQKRNVIIGTKLAETLQAQVGDTLELFFAEQTQVKNQKISLQSTNVTVGSIMKTGIAEFDRHIIFCSRALFERLFDDDSVKSISVRLKPGIDIPTFTQEFTARTGLSAYSWHDMYPALVAALKLEKYVMFLLLALVTLVASMNVVSLMFMLITQKRSDIAILRTMGAAPRDIMTIFMTVGISICTAASLLGIMLAAGACWVLTTYPFIELPDIYGSTHLPAQMEPHLVAIVWSVVMSIGCIAVWWPTSRTRTLNIAHILRFEG